MSDAGPSLPTERMTVEAFERWCGDRPGRFELSNGRIVAMASEKVAHQRLKSEAYVALRSGAPSGCEAFSDGMAVRVDERTQREPDAALRCGPRLPADATWYADPVVIVEVTSPSSSVTDTVEKLAEYAKLRSLTHYVILYTERRIVLHHRRTETGFLMTILPGGALVLDPPGLTLDLDAILDAAG